MDAFEIVSDDIIENIVLINFIDMALSMIGNLSGIIGERIVKIYPVYSNIEARAAMKEGGFFVYMTDVDSGVFLQVYQILDIISKGLVW